MILFILFVDILIFERMRCIGRADNEIDVEERAVAHRNDSDLRKLNLGGLIEMGSL